MTLIEPVLRWWYQENHQQFSYPSQQGNSAGQILALFSWPCEFGKACHYHGYPKAKRCGHLRWIPFIRSCEKEFLSVRLKTRIELYYHNKIFEKLDKIANYRSYNSHEKDLKSLFSFIRYLNNLAVITEYLPNMPPFLVP